ncbi:VWA domain-containing protein [Candidatus Acetothermia bacterium]|nr:VWA domain-containing protein [Candidatus Acetothermia bacterium]MCI2427793.1 VWA domain-containing protein [Candidatus Acetothermia bacterium]MCI2428282.1 VWA domain-containing protein [Candidatus Acetothermia bacterium]
MIIHNFAALSLLALGGAVILFHFLRRQRQRYRVSALFLWEGLRSDPHSLAERIRSRIDLLLLLQLLALILLVIALSRPALLAPLQRLHGLAIVLDSSVSMQTIVEPGAGVNRFEIAQRYALTLLERFPTTPVTILQLSSAPEVLFPLSTDHRGARQALQAAQPTLLSDGSIDLLVGMIAGQGGIDRFAQIIYFTDHRLTCPLAYQLEKRGFQQQIITGGSNVAIEAFTMREDIDQPGSTAFIRLANHSNRLIDTTLRVSDGVRRVRFDTFLLPNEKRNYILPFPVHEGTAFIASIDSDDDFLFDNYRFFALKRPIERRIRWLGYEDRFLQAAIRVIWNAIFVTADDIEPVNLIIANNTTLPADVRGNILLINSAIEKMIDIHDVIPGGPVAIEKPHDPFLAGIVVEGLRVWSLSDVTFPAGELLLTSGGQPLLYRLTDHKRRLIFFAADLRWTNLPLTVDFPILINNILAWFQPTPHGPPDIWHVVGEPLALNRFPNLQKLIDPYGNRLELGEDSRYFRPLQPGLYTIVTGRGTYSLAVNIPATESVFPVDIASAQITTMAILDDIAVTVQGERPLWRYLAFLSLFVLIGELYLYDRSLFGNWQRLRRKR